MITLIDMSHKENKLLFYEFVKPVAKIVEEEGFEYRIMHFTEVPDDMVRTGKTILCGTALKDNLFMQCKENFEWLRSVTIPVLGICAGMQAIGSAFGSVLERKKEIGMEKITVTRQDTLFSGKKRFDAYELHNFSVNPSDSFDILAVSKNCVQAIKHKTKPIYGVMFHPEVRNEWVVKRFLGLNQI